MNPAAPRKPDWAEPVLDTDGLAAFGVELIEATGRVQITGWINTARNDIHTCVLPAMSRAAAWELQQRLARALLATE